MCSLSHARSVDDIEKGSAVKDERLAGPVERPSGALPVIALTLMGGGARGAYQAGVLARLSEAAPELSIPILTGVSAGAINAAYLANSPGSLSEAAHGLSQLWAGLVTHRVVSDAPL